MRNVLELEVGYIKIYAVILYKSMLSSTPMPESKPTKSNNTSQTPTTTNNNIGPAIIPSQNPSTTQPSNPLSKTRSVPPTKKQPSQLEKNLQEIKDLENVIQNFENKIPSLENNIRKFEKQIPRLENDIRESLRNHQTKFVFTNDSKQKIINEYKTLSSPADDLQLFGKKDRTKANNNPYNNIPTFVNKTDYNNDIDKLNKLDTEVTTDLSKLLQDYILYDYQLSEVKAYFENVSYNYTVQLKVGEPIYNVMNDEVKAKYNKYINELNVRKRQVKPLESNVKALKESVKALKESVNTIKRGGKQKTRKQRVQHTRLKRRSTKRGSSTKTRK